MKQNQVVTKDCASVSKLLSSFGSFSEANQRLAMLAGLHNFFKDDEEFRRYASYAESGGLSQPTYKERQYGDYQTPRRLAKKICNYLSKIGCAPNVVIEPTYGEGSFIHAALDEFSSIECVYAVEIQEHYEFLFKTSLLKRIAEGERIAPKLELRLDNVFTHRFPRELVQDPTKELLVIGNPPWITNAELSVIGSRNVPKKSNIKKTRGIEAITGKSNFDLGEYVLLRMLELFSSKKGTMAFICKNIVIRNILRELPEWKFRLSESRALGIDSKREFQSSCDASVFICKLGRAARDFTCDVSLLEDPSTVLRSYGWSNSAFVSDIQKYTKTRFLEGMSALAWRSGIKHDCSKIVELSITESGLVNGKGDAVHIEDDLIFPLIKGSQIKDFEIAATKKMLIVPQHFLGENTAYIRKAAPLTWKYLKKNQGAFDARKSIIYANKPAFSIFGVGSYSFMPYKVAISAFYKLPKFSLIRPIYDKPALFDDTCYFLGFERYEEALFMCSVLNGTMVNDFLSSISFSDSKRVYTKDIMMRIDLAEAVKRTSFGEIEDIWQGNSFDPAAEYSEADYKRFQIGFTKKSLNLTKPA
jgi:hypothetical protein